MDTYCWIHSTFTIPDRVNAAVGSVVPHPGVATPDQDNPEDKHEAYATLLRVLVTVVHAVAPLLPFFAEELYQRLGYGKLQGLCPIVLPFF